MNRLEKNRKMIGVLTGFAEGHKGVLDDKGRAELDAMERRIAETLDAVDKACAGVVVSRTARDGAFQKLQKAIVETKKVVEWVVVRDGKHVIVPRIGKLIGKPGRIHILAEKVVKAAGQAGKDPVLVKTAAGLRAALDEYTASYGDTYDKTSQTSADRKAIAAGMTTLNGLVNAYRMMLTYRAAGNDRQELQNLLKAKFPKKAKKAAAAAQATTATTATAQPPALPALPTTIVPPSSEHPVVSANA